MNAGEATAGLDVKYGLSANLTADLTVNTDFAQVEVDEQQVNLTRFIVLFPEKRDFFLEGRGVFEFARLANAPGSGNASPQTAAPLVFYSRRIGLNAGRVVPIHVGTRLTGKAGKFSLGVMNLETGGEAATSTPATNFTVARVKRDILRRSNVGVLFTNRSRSALVPGASNQAVGVDAAFSFFESVNLGGYFARSITDGRPHRRDSGQARAEFAGDRYGAKLDYVMVGENFAPEIGFVRRNNFRRTFGSARFSPRPKASRRVRRYLSEATFEYVDAPTGRLESRQLAGRFSIEMQSSDTFVAEAHRNYELLLRPFLVSPGIAIPTGGYPFSDVAVAYSFGQQRPVSGSASIQQGEFYNGRLTSVGFGGGRIAASKQWSLEPGLSVNHVTLPVGRFTSTVARLRSDYGFSPRMFASGLVQYASTDRLFSTNFRYRWEYRPGSELFIVYTDERDTLASGFPSLKNRAFVIKINRLLRT